MCHEDDGLEGLVRSVPGEEMAVGVDHFMIKSLVSVHRLSETKKFPHISRGNVHSWIFGLQEFLELVMRLPSVVLSDGSHIIV